MCYEENKEDKEFNAFDVASLEAFIHMGSPLFFHQSQLTT